MKKLCENCGKEFNNEKNHHKQKFCRKNCCTQLWRKKHKKPLLIRFCKYCGKLIEIKNPKAIYCNRDCKHNFYMTTDKGKLYLKRYKQRHLYEIKLRDSKRKNYFNHYNRKYRQKNKDKLRDYNREYHKKWRKTEQYRIGRKFCEFIRKTNKGDLMKEDFEIIRNRDKFCVYCGSEANTFDHIIPIIKGGENSIKNIVLCCLSCNSSKGGMDVIEWCKKKKIDLPNIIMELLYQQSFVEVESIDYNKELRNMLNKGCSSKEIKEFIELFKNELNEDTILEALPLMQEEVKGV